MPQTVIEFDSHNQDIGRSMVHWWDRDEVYIEQVETQKQGEKMVNQILLVEREGVPALIAALQQFLES
jgi:hypothetical protein